MGGHGWIEVDTDAVGAAVAQVRTAAAELHALLHAPHLLRGSISRMAPPATAGALAAAGHGFLDAWQQALGDAHAELGRLADGLQLAIELYTAADLPVTGEGR